MLLRCRTKNQFMPAAGTGTPARACTFLCEHQISGMGHTVIMVPAAGKGERPRGTGRGWWQQPVGTER